MKRLICLLYLCFSLLFAPTRIYAQEEASNFLIGSWYIETEALPAELPEDSALHQINGLLISFAQATMSLPHRTEPIRVDYAIDGPRILVTPLYAGAWLDDFLHAFLVHDQLVLVEIKGWGLTENFMLRPR